MATHGHRKLATSLAALAALVGTVGGIQTSLASTASAADTTSASSSTSAAASWSSFTPAKTAATTATAPVAVLPAVKKVPSTATTLLASPSGVSAPRGNLPGWKQVYAEDFTIKNATGTFPSGGYERHWDVYEDGWKDTSKNGTYMPSKVLSTHDGVLDYFIRTENGTRMVAAPWLTDTHGTTYGRYSIRFRADNLPGYKNAWLLWPDSDVWPAHGEIDFPEGNLGAGDRIHAFAHHASSRGGQDAFPTNATFAAWHTVTVEWVPGKVTFLLDGKVIGVSTTMVPSKAMHWVLQTETNLDGTVPSALVKGHVLVDWVSFWTRG